tara:strand:- start:4278 stop:6152 length:1875 start_codon:yes stop_codon:yes gene_type:complete
MVAVHRKHEINLFGVPYPIIGPVQPVVASQFAEKQVFGDYSKESEVLRSSWVISDQRGGIGVKHMKEKRDHDRVWWSTAWLGTDGHLVAPVLATDATNPTGADARVLIEYANQLYCVFGTDLRRRIEGGNSWSATLGTLVGAPTDAIVHKSKLYFACGTDFNRYDGTTLTKGATLNAAQACRYFVEWDDKIYAIDDDGQMDVSTDEGVNWTADALSNLPSGYFTSLFKYHDGSSPPTVIIYLGTKAGLYAHDNANTKWTETELPLPFHDYGCVGADRWREWAFIPSGMAVYQYKTGSVAAEITPMGLDRAYGVPQAYAGNIVKLLRGHNFLYALVDATDTLERTLFGGEGAGGLGDAVIYDNTGYSAVFRWDGYGWSVVYLSTSADTPIRAGTVCTADDNYRLWFGIDNTVFYVPLPVTLENPVEVSASTFAASFENISPWFDADNEVETKLAAEVIGYYTSMSANEYFKVYYGTDFDDDTWTLLTNSDFPDGQIDRNGEATFELASGAGVAFKAIRFKEEGYRGSTNTLTPDRRWLRLSYVPLLATKWGFKTRVDCSRNYRFKTAAALQSALKTAKSAQAMGEFTFKNGNGSETHRVSIADMPGVEVGGRKNEGVYDVTLVAP